MTDTNTSQTTLDEDMEDTQPRHKRNCPNDSPDPKDQLPNKNTEICGHCKKKCISTSEALQCDLCSSWVHASCEGFSKKQYSSINQSLDNMMFYCHLNNCVTRSKQFIFANVEASLTSFHGSDNTFQSLVKEQDTIHLILSQLSEKVNELC